MIPQQLDMVCKFTKEGIIKPIKFRFRDNNSRVYKVTQIVSHEQQMFSKNMLYKCKVKCEDLIYQVEIRYLADRSLWRLETIENAKE